MSPPGENAKRRAILTPEQRLEWQTELDSAMTDLDFKLSHPRRRAGDVTPQPALPQLGKLDLSAELLDEIAWRVSEQMRRSGGQGAAANVVANASALLDFQTELPQPEPEPTPAPAPAPRAVPENAVLVIRLRRPLFRWRFWRRRLRRQRMISFSDYRVS